MYCLVTTKKTDGKVVIVKVEALQYEPTDLVHTGGTGDYLFTTTDETTLNQLLNDYGHVTAHVNADEKLTLDFTGVSTDTHVRKIADADWLKRTRPALMRAATTTALFNA